MAVCRMNEVHQHIPVLLGEAIDSLITSADGIYVDATFGRGSHSRAILSKLNKNGSLIAFDKDPAAVEYAKSKIQDPRFTILHSSFARMQVVLNELHLVGQIKGILFDLGVSSPQLDDPDRGFSFAREGKLDMRMDTTQGLDAMGWIAKVDEKELADVLWQYGEEKASRRIARKIVAVRAETPIKTTTQLASIIASCLPKPKKPQDKHPATRSFQAIRIAINQELTDLKLGLEQALEVLAVGGRLCAISFHSLEDRQVKQFMREHEKGQELPRGLPIKHHEFDSRLKTIGKPVKPTDSEINTNPRARSAVLRIAEKLS